MPAFNENNIHILDGKAMLYKRSSSPHWQVKYKAHNKWHRTTTKQEDEIKAKEVALKIVTKAWHREEENLPIASKKFKQIANQVVTQMKNQLDSGVGKATYKTYIQALNKYHIEYLGNYNIDRIDDTVIKKFVLWREKEMKRKPSQSCINNHNVALNRVFDEAIRRKYMTLIQKPILENKGVKTEKRPSFSKEEYEKLYIHMRTWLAEARNGPEGIIRNLIRNYVLIVANTGIRPGTEGMNLKWKHIYFEKINGVDNLAMYINGKTGGRIIYAKSQVTRYLQRIQQKDEVLKKMTFEEVLDAKLDTYVFRYKDRDKTSDFGKVFKKMLENAELLKDTLTDKDRSLYSLRHYYATEMLKKGNVTIYQLAEYMGTSVKMIEKHYGQIQKREIAHKFIGVREARLELKYGKNDVRPIMNPSDESDDIDEGDD